MGSRKYILVATLVCFITARAQDPLKNLEMELQATLENIVAENDIPGLTFTLEFDAQNTINLAAGYSDMEHKTKMEPHNRMPSGSVGKMFVSTMVLKLAEEGKIKLNEKASSYLGDIAWFSHMPNAADITITNLLNHTSGLPRYIFQPEFLEDIKKNPLKDRSTKECLSYVLNKPPLHAAGKGWAYSDANYLILGMVVEKVAKKTYYELLKHNILSAMQLTLTEPSVRRSFEDLSQGYVGSQNYFGLPKKVVQDGMLAINPAFEWTGGGVVTNVRDLARFAKNLHEGNLLDGKSKKLLTKAVNMGNGQAFDQGYGLGSFVWSKRNDTRYGHSGFFPGYLSHVEYSKNRQYAIAIQINTDEGYLAMQQYVHEIDEVISKYLDEIDERKILENFKKQEACWNSGDMECYMQAYAQNEPIQTASRGGVTFGYDNIIRDYKKYFPKNRMGDLYFDQFNLRRLADNLYFVTGRFNLKFSDREELSRGWFSVNMQRIDGEWKMITDHSS